MVSLDGFQLLFIFSSAGWCTVKGIADEFPTSIMLDYKYSLSSGHFRLIITRFESKVLPLLSHQRVPLPKQNTLQFTISLPDISFL